MARARRDRGDSADDDNTLDIGELVDQSTWSPDIPARGRSVAAESHRLQRESIELQRDSIELQAEANFLHAAQLQVAVASNEILGQIDRSLDQIGFGINQLHDDMARQEALQAEQLRRQDEHLRQQATHIDLTRQQLELQKQQVEKVERDRLVKDLLYNLERYNKRLTKIADAVARAYGARRLLERLSISRFTSADLFEIADKRHFDEQMAIVNGFVSALDAEGKRTLEQFEKAYTDYLKANQTDLSADAPEARQRLTFSEDRVRRARPRPPEHNGHPLDSATADTLYVLAAHCTQKRLKARAITLAGGIAAGVFALLTALCVMAALNGSGIAMPAALSTGVLMIASLLLAACPPIRSKAANLLGEEGVDADADEEKLIDRYGLNLDQVTHLLDAWRQYAAAARAFDRDLPKRLQQERTRIEEHNRTVEQTLAQRTTLIADRKAKRSGSLGALRQWINAYLDKHPGIQDWVPKLAQ